MYSYKRIKGRNHSVEECVSSAELYRRGGLIISREQGLCYGAGFAVPVLMS